MHHSCSVLASGKKPLSSTVIPSLRDCLVVVLQAEAGAAGGPHLAQAGLVRGYGVVNTPAFTPGPEQSPLMTWGDIGSTPIRLDQEDDIHVSTSTGKQSVIVIYGFQQIA